MLLLGGDARHQAVGEAQEQAMRRISCRAEPITLASSDPQVGTPPITIGDNPFDGWVVCAFERQGACPQLVLESCAKRCVSKLGKDTLLKIARFTDWQQLTDCQGMGQLIRDRVSQPLGFKCVRRSLPRCFGSVVISLRLWALPVSRAALMLPHVGDFVHDRLCWLLSGHRARKPEKSIVTTGRFAQFRSLEMCWSPSTHPSLVLSPILPAKPPNLLHFSCMSKLQGWSLLWSLALQFVTR